MRVFPAIVLSSLACIALSACSRPEAAPIPVIRPVISVIVEPAAASADSFVGTVVSRGEIAYAFRLGGMLTTRTVDLGDTVRTGQLLATLHATALQLAVTRAEADLASAQGQLNNISAAETRLQALQLGDNATQAQLEAVGLQHQSAEASVAQGQSALDTARQQLDEASIRAQADGVVTSVDAEIGQAMAPGGSVLKVSRPDARDLAIDVPEGFASSVKPGTMFRIVLQLDRRIVISGRLREIAPQADTMTRAHRLLIELVDPSQAFWIGTTATASVIADGSPNPEKLEIPTSAVLTMDGMTSVWIVDETAGTVSRREVAIDQPTGDRVAVSSGLQAGDRVVTLGVGELADGQKIRLETGE